MEILLEKFDQKIVLVYRGVCFTRGDQMTTKRKKIELLIGTVFIILIIGGIYFYSLCTKYQEIKINQNRFYGSENQNLKDFKVENGKLTSLTGDPWVTCILDEKIDIKLIEIDIEDIEKKHSYAEIFDMEEWTSKRVRLHNGKVLVFYKNNQGQNKQQLRFDLVEEPNVSLDVSYVTINSKYGMIYYTVIQLIPLLLGVLLIEIMMFAVWDAESKTAVKGHKLFYGSCLAVQLFVLIFTFITVMVRNLNSIELIWLWMVCLIEVFLTTISIVMKLESWPYMGKFSGEWVQTILFILISFGMLEILSGIGYNFQDIFSAIWNYTIILLIYMVLYLMFRQKKIAIIIVNIFVMILGIANHYFYQFRGKPLEVSDIMLAETALTVFKNYTYHIDAEMTACIGIEMGLFFWIKGMEGKCNLSRKQWQIYVVTIFAGVMGLVSYKPDVSYWNMTYSTQVYGYLNAFVAYARNDLKNNKPQNYSKEYAANILNQYTIEGGVEEPVNIIVIMNEAFSDLPLTYGFETDVDGLPFIHSLKTNTIKGNMKVSVFGGSTADTEWEFLTGNSMAFLNGGMLPYMQYIKGKQQSLASELKNLGYQTVAFHPCEAGNYNRDKVYPLMGFDVFYSIESDLKYNNYLRYMMSDESDFLNVIDMYENRDESQPFFMFNVTMQNHGGYSYNESAVEVTVKPEDENLQYTQLKEYLSLIKETDRAFEELVTYFSGVDEKTVILMFGDHQPGLDEDVYNALCPELYQDDITLETMQKKYTVPFILWANYDIESESNVLISPGYLRAKLLETAGIPMSRYDQFLTECNGQYNAVNILGYYDQNGKLYGIDSVDEEKMLVDYQILQYANMFDRKVKNEFEK